MMSVANTKKMWPKISRDYKELMRKCLNLFNTYYYYYKKRTIEQYLKKTKVKYLYNNE